MYIIKYIKCPWFLWIWFAFTASASKEGNLEPSWCGQYAYSFQSWRYCVFPSFWARTQLGLPATFSHPYWVQPAIQCTKESLFRHQVYRIFHCRECQARFTVFCGTLIILLSTHGKTPKASQRPSTGLRASEAPILTWMTWKRCWATWVTSRSIRRPHVQKWARSYFLTINLKFTWITDNHW